MVEIVAMAIATGFNFACLCISKRRMFSALMFLLSVAALSMALYHYKTTSV
jgi:hypothetical protein